ncbi:MAG TPA: MurR/RpiR family transcriptional regulator [Acidobacteriaceae bacterium]|nr:MurR/RpiR family transcriptional regulator [Acidobacteriaceae bacterium]
MKTKTTLASVRTESEIARKLDGLPEQSRELIRSIFEYPRDYVLLSLRQVARKLSVDASTLLRWLRALGFHKYADFRIYLHERAINLATSIEALERTPPQTGVPGLVHNSLECDLRNLQSLRAAIDPDRLLNVARHLWKARRIFILAGDMSASLGSYLEYTLSMIGMNAVHAPTPGAMVHRTRSASSADLVLAITFGRGLSATVEALAQGSRQSAFCVGVSDNYLSPLVDLCQEFFITPTERASFATSYTGAMAFLNALLVVVTSLRQENLQPVLESISEEQRTSERFYSRQRR